MYRVNTIEADSQGHKSVINTEYFEEIVEAVNYANSQVANHISRLVTIWTCLDRYSHSEELYDIILHKGNK